MATSGRQRHDGKAAGEGRDGGSELGVRAAARKRVTGPLRWAWGCASRSAGPPVHRPPCLLGSSWLGLLASAPGALTVVPAGPRARLAMPLGLFRRLLLAALLLVIVWTLFGPSGFGEELLSLSLASLLPAPASPGPPLALPRLLIPNPQACGGPGPPPFLLVLVCTAPEHLSQRRAIRGSWGAIREARGFRVQTLFLLGEPTGQHVPDLASESAAHKDILQAAFQDSYRNLTLKTLSGLNWVRKYCPGARYILKTDDDVYVNVPELVSELIQRGGPSERWQKGRGPQEGTTAAHEEHQGQAVPLLYLGRVHWRVSPTRTPGARHHVSEELWPETWGPFPPYASGTGYVLSASAVHLILKVASRAPHLPLEDVFVGVSARRGGLAPTHCVKLAGATHYPLDRCCYGKFLLTSHRLDPWKMQEAWKLVNRLHGESAEPFCSWPQAFLGVLRCRFIAWLNS